MSRVLVVTGGGRGIGAATARRAARDGYAVGIGYRADADSAAQVVADCRALGVHAVAIQGDVAVEGDVIELFDRVTAELGPVTALANNAGVVVGRGRVEDLEIDRLQRVLTVNVVGAFLCARKAVRRMSTRHGGAGGSIVNVSSRAAVLGSADDYVEYAAAKAAVDALTIGLAREVAGDGIRVNGVRPGLIGTEIHAEYGDPDRVARVASSIPMGRGGEADEVAAAILWLMSDDASYVTGAHLDVSGGR